MNLKDLRDYLLIAAAAQSLGIPGAIARKARRALVIVLAITGTWAALLWYEFGPEPEPTIHQPTIEFLERP